MPPKKKGKRNTEKEREREEILQDFMDNIENEDDYDDIFQSTDSELEDGNEDSYENVEIENINVNIETNANEIIEEA